MFSRSPVILMLGYGVFGPFLLMADVLITGCDRIVAGKSSDVEGTYLATSVRDWGWSRVIRTLETHLDVDSDIKSIDSSRSSISY